MRGLLLILAVALLLAVVVSGRRGGNRGGRHGHRHHRHCPKQPPCVCNGTEVVTDAITPTDQVSTTVVNEIPDQPENDGHSSSSSGSSSSEESGEQHQHAPHNHRGHKHRCPPPEPCECPGTSTEPVVPTVAQSDSDEN